jgi:hypothetical protein
MNLLGIVSLNKLEITGGMKKMQDVSTTLLIPVSLMASLAAIFDFPSSSPYRVLTSIPLSSSSYLIKYMFRTPVGAIAHQLIPAFRKAAPIVPCVFFKRGAVKYLPTVARVTALVTARA